MNDLLSNIDKIHTTELGIVRIKRNLSIETDDVVKWCKHQIQYADDIVRRGKNWYAYVGNAIITVNAHSYTVITAHKKTESKTKPYPFSGFHPWAFSSNSCPSRVIRAQPRV
jgi:hypothetical protein